MNLRKAAGLIALAFAVFYAISNPHNAANAVHAIASGLASFASDLANGDGR
ncbi:hypothetical protein [Krasilnikovia sp. MM14-A1004]|uniref:hypothetical protein n=1 Tax=Krasilnikovia sp. MM14-A1004 TaxID=3373541 RepID=UPI00399C5014